MSDLPVPVEHTIHARPRVDSERPGPERPIEAETDEPAAGLVPDYVRKLAWVLDDAIPIVAGRRVGIDGFLSFIPVVGEAAGFGLAATVVLAGVKAGASWPTVARMMFHTLGESLFGMIPLAGPVIAFFWKANQRNLRIIESDLRDREATRRESWKVLLVAVSMVAIGALFVLVSLAFAIYTIWQWIFG